MSNALDNSQLFEKKKLKIPIIALQGLDAKEAVTVGVASS